MKKLLLLLVIFPVMFSCKNNTTTVTSVKNGDITGFAFLLDTTHQSLKSHYGIYVEIVGTNFKATSDSSGKWKLRDVPPGVYDFRIWKSGFDSLLLFGFSFPGNGTGFIESIGLNFSATDRYIPYRIGLEIGIEKILSSVITDLTIGDKYNLDTLRKEYYMPAYIKLGIKSDVTFFFGRSSELSKWGYTSQFNTIAEGDFVEIPQDFLNYWFKSGEKVYAICYPGTGGWTQDKRGGNKHWMMLGQPTKVVSFIVP